MRRRRYLALIGTTTGVTGCIQAPAAPDLSRRQRDGRADQSTDTELGSDDNDPYDGENVADYRHDKGEWFDLDDGIAAMVSGTERRDAAAFGESGDDVYIVELRVENRIDEPVVVEHDPFWLEKLGPEQAPDSGLSEQLERGATGESTQLAPGAHRRLNLAFRVPDDIEPKYLWVNAHYICLVL